MLSIEVRNVHQALPLVLSHLQAKGVPRNSRNGQVVCFPETTAITYTHPKERVLFWGARDANPFFHLYEAMWMLAGRNDVESVARFVKRMRTFSDDGETFHGAYGYRWRHHFGKDQLASVINTLRKDPTNRRQVIAMWDAFADLGRHGRDLPCNLAASVQISPKGALDLTVFNRSNDIIWGALGANAVHFSILQEYLAEAIGVPVGTYTQVSANMHAYSNILQKVQALAEVADPFNVKGLEQQDPYCTKHAFPFPLLSIHWGSELEIFVNSSSWEEDYTAPFLKHVAAPMMRAWLQHKQGKQPNLDDMSFCDWRLAASEWLARRHNKSAQHAQDDGVNYE